MFKKKIAVVLVTLTALCFSGCGMVDQLQQWKNGEADVAAINPPTSAGSEQLITVSPAEAGNVVGSETLKTAAGMEQDLREVTLYFANSDGSSLVAEKRQIPKAEGMARAVMNELILGPDNSDLLPTIPTGTALKDINIKEDGCCILDFSGDLINNHPGGSVNEELTVASIMSTLAQFPAVEEVQILVDGKNVPTIAGHVDISQAMAIK